MQNPSEISKNTFQGFCVAISCQRVILFWFMKVQVLEKWPRTCLSTTKKRCCSLKNICFLWEHPLAQKRRYQAREPRNMSGKSSHNPLVSRKHPSRDATFSGSPDDPRNSFLDAFLSRGICEPRKPRAETDHPCKSPQPRDSSAQGFMD